jgi:hypothetical protein
MSSLKRKTEYSKYLSFINNHKIEEALTYYDNNCEIKFNGSTIIKRIDQS